MGVSKTVMPHSPRVKGPGRVGISKMKTTNLLPVTRASWKPIKKENVTNESGDKAITGTR